MLKLTLAYEHKFSACYNSTSTFMPAKCGLSRQVVSGDRFKYMKLPVVLYASKLRSFKTGTLLGRGLSQERFHCSAVRPLTDYTCSTSACKFKAQEGGPWFMPYLTWRLIQACTTLMKHLPQDAEQLRYACDNSVCHCHCDRAASLRNSYTDTSTELWLRHEITKCLQLHICYYCVRSDVNGGYRELSYKLTSLEI